MHTISSVGSLSIVPALLADVIVDVNLTVSKNYADRAHLLIEINKTNSSHLIHTYTLIKIDV